MLPAFTAQNAWARGIAAGVALLLVGCGIGIQRDLSTMKPPEVVYDDVCGLQEYFDALKSPQVSPPSETFAQDFSRTGPTRAWAGRRASGSERVPAALPPPAADPELEAAAARGGERPVDRAGGEVGAEGRGEAGGDHRGRPGDGRAPRAGTCPTTSACRICCSARSCTTPGGRSCSCRRRRPTRSSRARTPGVVTPAMAQVVWSPGDQGRRGGRSRRAVAQQPVVGRDARGARGGGEAGHRIAAAVGQPSTDAPPIDGAAGAIASGVAPAAPRGAHRARFGTLAQGCPRTIDCGDAVPAPAGEAAAAAAAGRAAGRGLVVPATSSAS